MSVFVCVLVCVCVCVYVFICVFLLMLLQENLTGQNSVYFTHQGETWLVHFF